MGEEIVYMLGVVAVGFAVNYSLRALPFVLFSGRDRELPRWVERFGAVISPVIIGALIVYSFATLRAADGTSACLRWWPFAAGALVVGLQLWRRNSLVSIVAGTLVYMMLLNCGCVTDEEVRLGSKHPTISVRADGVYWGEEKTDGPDVASRLEDCNVSHDATIHIRVDGNVANYFNARTLMNDLARAGYTSPVLVTEWHAASAVVDPEERRRQAAPSSRSAARPGIRYKSANE